jgi:hypothetical protein
MLQGNIIILVREVGLEPTEWSTWGDLNSHSCLGRQVLSLLCLPFHHTPSCMAPSLSLLMTIGTCISHVFWPAIIRLAIFMIDMK